MKTTDYFSIILIAGVGVVASFFLFQFLLGDPDAAYVDYTAIGTTISNKLVDPDPEIFGPTAINPTVEVYVGDCEDIDQNGILDDAEIEACYATVDDEMTQGAEGGTTD